MTVGLGGAPAAAAAAAAAVRDLPAISLSSVEDRKNVGRPPARAMAERKSEKMHAISCGVFFMQASVFWFALSQGGDKSGWDEFLDERSALCVSSPPAFPRRRLRLLSPAQARSNKKPS